MKNRNQLGTTIDAELHEKLKILAKNRGVKIWKLVDEAVEMLLQSYETPKIPRNNNSRQLGELNNSEVIPTYTTNENLAEEDFPISDKELNDMADAIALLRAKKNEFLSIIQDYKPQNPIIDEDLDQPIELTKEEKREILLKRKQKTFGQGSVYDDIDLNNKENSSLDPEELFDLVDENERKKKKGKKEQRSIFDDMEVDLLPSEPIELDDYPKKSKK